MSYAIDTAGWHVGAVADGTPGAVDVPPPLGTATTVPGQLRARWLRYAWAVQAYTPPPVPPEVTRRQAKQALLLAGILGAVQGAIDAIPDATQRSLAQIEWDDSQAFERNRPILITLAGALGLTSGQLDELFITAAGL